VELSAEIRAVTTTPAPVFGWCSLHQELLEPITKGKPGFFLTSEQLDQESVGCR